MKHFKLILLLSALTFSSLLRAQYEVSYYTHDKGLPYKAIHSEFFESSNGYIWYMDEGALCRFDGFEIERFWNPKMKESLLQWDPPIFKEYRGGLAFEHAGFFYYVKNGSMHVLNDSAYQELDAIQTFDTDSELRIYANGAIYNFNNGVIVKDSIPSYLRGYNFRTDNQGTFRYIKSNRLYSIKNGKVDSIEIDIKPVQVTPLWLAERFEYTWAYRCFETEDSRLVIHSNFSDSMYIIKDGKINNIITLNKSEVLKNPDIQDAIVSWNWFSTVPTAQRFWTQDEDFSLYANGAIITEEEVYSFPKSKEYHSVDLVGKFSGLFLKDQYLYLIDFKEKKITPIRGVENFSYVQFPLGNVISKGRVLTCPRDETITTLNPSRIEYINHEKIFYNGTFIPMEGVNGHIDEKGSFYGTARKEYARTESVMKADDHFGLMVDIKDKNTYKELPADREVFKYYNNGEVVVLAENTGTLERGLNFIQKKGKEIKTSNRIFSFFNDSLYTLDQNTGKWYSADFNNEKLVFSWLPSVFKSTIIEHDQFLVAGYAWKNEELGYSSKITWLNQESNYLDSLVIETRNRPQFNYVGNGIVLVLVDESDTIDIVNMNSGDKTKIGLDMPVYASSFSVYEWHSSGAVRSFDNTDKKGNIWLKCKDGIAEISTKDEPTTRFYKTSFDFFDINYICTVQDSILLVLSESTLYCANKKNESVRIKPLLQFEPGCYNKMSKLDDGRIAISPGDWAEYIILPSDFYTNPLYDKPEIHIKEFKVGNKKLYGQFANFDSLKIEELTNVFASDENDLYFKFTALDFRNLDYLDFRFKLEGWEEGWHYTDRPEMKFNNLAEGDYTLTVQSRYMDRFSEPFVYSFTIKPPWYKSSWAYTFYIIGLIFLFWAFLKLRTRQLLKKQEVLEGKIEEATEEIREQKHMVEERNQEIMDSITYAKRLQTAILPPQKLVKEWLNDSFIFYKPKDIVAGDFYWMETTKRNGRSVIFYAAADCTGHGVPGAMVSVVCSNALKRAIKEFDISDPGQLLDKVAEIVQESFEQSEHEVKDGMDIAVCAIDLLDRKVWFAGAHNSLYRITGEDTKVPEGLKTLESGNRKLVEYSANKQPVGAFEHMEPFTTIEIDLEPGDCIYLFSDGFADQFGGEKGKKFKYKPFKQLLLDIEDKEMDSQKDILDTEFERWKGNLEQVDDVCIIGLRVNGHMRKLFSKRELEVIKKIKDGLRSKEIADELHIAKSTVDSHRKRILAKTNLNSVVELMKFCDDHEVL